MLLFSHKGAFSLLDSFLKQITVTLFLNETFHIRLERA